MSIIPFALTDKKIVDKIAEKASELGSPLTTEDIQEALQSPYSILKNTLLAGLAAVVARSEFLKDIAQLIKKPLRHMVRPSKQHHAAQSEAKNEEMDPLNLYLGVRQEGEEVNLAVWVKALGRLLDMLVKVLNFDDEISQSAQAIEAALEQKKPNLAVFFRENFHTFKNAVSILKEKTERLLENVSKPQLTTPLEEYAQAHDQFESSSLKLFEAIPTFKPYAKKESETLSDYLARTVIASITLNACLGCLLADRKTHFPNWRLRTSTLDWERKFAADVNVIIPDTTHEDDMESIMARLRRPSM